MSSELTRKLTYRKSKWKERVRRALAEARMQYLLAHTQQHGMMADFYATARKLYDLGNLGLRLMADISAEGMASRVLHNVAWTCLTIKKMSAAMYAVAERNNWPLQQFPTFTSAVLQEYEIRRTDDEEETD